MRYSAQIRPVLPVPRLVGLWRHPANHLRPRLFPHLCYPRLNHTLVPLIVFAVILCFTFISGLWAATITDFFQVCLGVIAVPLMLTLLANRYGGFDAIAANWFGNDFMNVGIGGQTAPVIALTYPSWLNFVICFAAALVWGNNYYWMKTASCRSEKVARKSFILAAILLTVIFTIPFAIIGLYGGAFFGDADRTSVV